MKRIAMKLVLLVFGSLAGLVIAELGLRLLGISYPLTALPDPHVGWRLQPGFSFHYANEGSSDVQINQSGFRDREHPTAKPPGAYRIAVLGDSYAEAIQVSLDETFWSVMSDRLKSCTALDQRHVEAMNFGVSGHGTAQQLQVLRHYVWQFEPDVVLLAFCGGNDLRNNSPELESEKARPFFQLRDGELVLDNSFLRHPDFQNAQRRWTKWKVALINRLRLLQLLHECKTKLSQAGSAQSLEATGTELGIDDLSLVEPRSEVWRKTWDVTDRIISEMARETRAHGAMFCVVTVTSGIQVHPDRRVRSELERRLAAQDLFYAEHRMLGIGQREGFPVVVPGFRMRELAERNGTYWHGFSNTQLGLGHWNAEGHRIVGELVAEQLCAESSSPADASHADPRFSLP